MWLTWQQQAGQGHGGGGAGELMHMGPSRPRQGCQACRPGGGVGGTGCTHQVPGTVLWPGLSPVQAGAVVGGHDATLVQPVNREPCRCGRHCRL